MLHVYSSTSHAQIKTWTDHRQEVTTFYYDHEEATLGDLNGDGLTNQTHGNVVKVRFPDVSTKLYPRPGSR